MKRFFLTTWLLAVVLLIAVVNLWPVPWTTIASVGEIDSSTKDLYFTFDTYITFKDPYTGDICIRYSVVNPMDSSANSVNWSKLRVSYVDQNQDSFIIVRLKKMVFESGNQSTIATFDSNYFGDCLDFVWNEVGFSHAFDFEKNAYYIEVILHRDSVTPLNPALCGVQLAEDIIY